MPWIANDETFEWTINATEQSSPTLANNLNTSEHGLMLEEYIPERRLAPREGYFDGLPPVDDLERYENIDIAFRVYLSDATKVMVNTDGQIFQFQHKLRDGTIDKITYVGKSKVKRAVPGKDDSGRLIINFAATIYDLTTTVA